MVITTRDIFFWAFLWSDTKVVFLALNCVNGNLREWLRDAGVRYGRYDLLPHERSQSEEDAPHPLLKVEGRCREGPSSEFDDEDLTKVGKCHSTVIQAFKVHLCTFHSLKELQAACGHHWVFFPSYVISDIHPISTGTNRDSLIRRHLKKLSHLSDEGENPDGVVDWICEEADENVSLAVNLSSVNLVEDGHHDERVEDHSEVNGRRGGDARSFAVVNVEKKIAWTDSKWRIKFWTMENLWSLSALINQ